MCDCTRLYVYACVKTSTLRNGSALSPMRFLTLCLVSDEGGARNKYDGGKCNVAECTRFSAVYTGCLPIIGRLFAGGNGGEIKKYKFYTS